MNQNQIFEQHAAPVESDIGVMDLLITLAKHKRKILVVTVGAAVFSLAASFAIPPEYQAMTKLLPPQQSQSSAAALLSQLGGVAGAVAAGASGLKSPNDLYIGMLKSRSIADQLITRFDLKKVYETNSLEKARKKLESDTSITSGKDGLISVVVEGKDKKLVAQLANAYVDELFRLMKTLAVTDAAQRRLFYERQLAATKDKLANAEMALKGAMDTQGVISVDVESRAILENVARLRAQVSAKEIQLESMSAFVTAANPEYRRVVEELSSLKSELGRLENGRGAANTDVTKTSGLNNIKLLRDLKYQQMLYEVLAKQYEVARIDEAKDPSLIQVLDTAVEPEKKSKPNRTFITIAGAVLSLLVSIFWAFFSDSRERAMQTPEFAARWNELKRHMRAREDRKS
jgi:uncharacterized protein involved in exopolysaccharide biosynthesis